VAFCLLIIFACLAVPAAEVVDITPDHFSLGKGAIIVPTAKEGSVARMNTIQNSGTPVNGSRNQNAGMLVSASRNLEPGRYRATFLLAASAFSNLKHSNSADVPLIILTASGDGVEQALNLDGTRLPAAPPLNSNNKDAANTPEDPEKGTVADVDDAWTPNLTAIPLDFAVPRAARVTLSVSLQGRFGEYACAGPLRLERTDPGVLVTRVFPNKLMYEPGEQGTLDVALLNYSAAVREVTLTTLLVQELALEIPVPAVTVSVAAGATKTAQIPFTAPKKEFGCEARVTVVAGGKALDSAGDVFNVSSNFEQVSIGGFSSNVSGMTGTTSLQSAAGAADYLRKQYCNKLEKIFWPPDDWGNMAPAVEEWISGQTARDDKKTVIQAFIKAAHAQGIKVTTYGKHVAGGTAGWELYRARPEWFYTNGSGVPQGLYFSSDMRTWDDIAYHNEHHKEYWTTYWMGTEPDLRRVDTLDWGIDNVIASIAMFGWDGIRFDGHWTSGNDELSAWNARRMKERIWAKYPNFRFGFNYSFTPGFQASVSGTGWMPGLQHELEENVTGGMYMSEAIRGFGYSYTGKSYSSWREMATREVAAGDILHKLGGNYEWCWFPDDPGPARDIHYKFAIGTIAGAHPAYDMGKLEWGRFLTRWSGIVYDPAMRSIDPKDQLEVTSTSPLWWKEFVKERIPDPATRQVIVHLLNPPVNERIGDKSPCPAPLKHVQLKIAVPAGQRLAHVTVLDPDGFPEAQPLAAQVAGGWATITVPAVNLWSIVVCEFAGQFTPLPPRPRFIREPDPAQVEIGRKLVSVPQAIDPLRPDFEHVGNKAIYALARNADGTVIVTDPAAKSVDNTVSRSDDTTRGKANRHRVTDVLLSTPGHYRATFRVKLENVTPQTLKDNGWCQVKFEGYGGGSKLFTNTLAPKDFTTAGAYREIPGEFDYDWQGPLTLQATFTCPNGGNAANFDTVTLECLERYTDAQLAAKAPKVSAPADFTIGGPPGLDILWVRGVFDGLYHIDDALKAFPDAKVTNVETWHGGVNPKRCPFNWDTFRKYDLVIFSNVLAPSDYAMRLALRDFVNKGGGLIILGGPFSLGQGGYCGTPQETQMPVTLRNGKDLEAYPTPPTLAPATGATLLAGVTPEQWKAAPKIYWRHRVTVKPTGHAQLLAGEEPVLLTSTSGAGRVAVFTGTPLGGPGLDNDRRTVKILTPYDGQTPWWNWNGWTTVMTNVLRWTGGPAVTQKHPANSDEPAPTTALPEAPAE